MILIDPEAEPEIPPLEAECAHKTRIPCEEHGTTGKAAKWRAWWEAVASWKPYTRQMPQMHPRWLGEAIMCGRGVLDIYSVFHI